MAGRRILLFIVLLLVIAAVSSAVAPREQRLPRAEPEPRPAGPPAEVVQGALPGRRQIRARVGEIVRIRVTHGAQDMVEIASLGVSEPVEAGVPAELEFDADRAGRFPITLRDAARRIGTVDVREGG